MHYHIILTEKCDSECRYCYEKSMDEFSNELEKKFKFDFSAPCVSNVDLDKLKEFLIKDSEPVLIFYGGEPLMQIDKIKSIIDKLDGTNVKFRMQTNAKLLHLLPIDYLKKIDKILISLDGAKDRTDKNRGEGTFDKVMRNILDARNNGYTGEIVARMTIAQDCADLYDQVLSLIENGFASIHWQLDVGFYKEDYDKENISKFLEEYNSNISKLIDYWVMGLESGNILRLYPLLGITESLLKNEKTELRCGAGHSGYCITTDGKVAACPIMNNIENFVAGDLDNSPEELKKFNVAGRCDNCEDRDLCGGRCLYWNQAGLWPEEGNDLICESIRHLIFELKKNMSRIREAIDSGVVSIKDFEYERYFGPEIIP